jgi:hypothetical protein
MIFEERKGNSFQPDEVIYPVRKACVEARGKIKDSYTFLHGVKAPCKSLLAGFTAGLF